MDELLHSCPSCGTLAVPEAAYCHRCGSPLIGEGGPFEGPEEEFTEAAPPHPREGGRDGGEGEAPMEGGFHPEPPRSEYGDRQAGGLDAERGVPPRPSGGPQATPDASTARAGASASRLGVPSGFAGGYTGPSEFEIGPGTPDPSLERALNGEYNVRMGDWMTKGWATFTRAGGLFVAFAAIAWLLIFFATPILLVLSPLIASGFLTAALVARRGESVQFSDFWLPFNDFLPLFLAWIVSSALLFAGLLTCGVLTVYLWVGYQFAYLLILDRRMEFWHALEASRKAVTKHWISLLGFAFILFTINFVALAAGTFGLIISLPLTSCFLVEAYAEIFGVRGGLRRQPDPLAAPFVPSRATLSGGAAATD